MICEKWELGTGKLEIVTRKRENEETKKKGKKEMKGMKEKGKKGKRKWKIENRN